MGWQAVTADQGEGKAMPQHAQAEQLVLAVQPLHTPGDWLPLQWQEGAALGLNSAAGGAAGSASNPALAAAAAAKQL